MKRHQRNKDTLLLDDIYNSNDPTVRRFISKALIEEMDKAQERALIRTAKEFQHLLSPRMQQVLSARYPATDLAASA